MPRKPKVKTTNVKEGIKPTIPTLDEVKNMQNTSVSNQSTQNKSLLENKEINKGVDKAMSTAIQEGFSKVLKGGARLNLLSMMFSPTSAAADPVVDPETGINRFTGETEFTPMFDQVKQNRY